jgi:hypothetical protein
VNAPNTVVPDPGKGELALTWQDLDEDTSGLDNRTAVRAVYGIAPKWEIGGLWGKAKDTEDLKIWGANVKYQVMREPEKQFGLAVGLAYGKLDFSEAAPPTGDQAVARQVEITEDAKWTRYYLVLSKKLSPAAGEESAIGQVTGLIGLVGDRLTNSESESEANLMLGLEAVMRGGTYVGLEWRDKWKDVGKSIFSVVARHKISPQITAELGWTNSLAFVGEDTRKIFVGVSWAFGMPKGEY